MSENSVSRQRKDEILAKKAKLAALKRQRELRQQELINSQANSESTNSKTSSDYSSLTSRYDTRRELDSLISSLVGDRRSSTPATITTTPTSTTATTTVYSSSSTTTTSETTSTSTTIPCSASISTDAALKPSSSLDEPTLPLNSSTLPPSPSSPLQSNTLPQPSYSTPSPSLPSISFDSELFATSSHYPQSTKFSPYPHKSPKVKTPNSKSAPLDIPDDTNPNSPTNSSVDSYTTYSPLRRRNKLERERQEMRDAIRAELEQEFMQKLHLTSETSLDKSFNLTDQHYPLKPNHTSNSCSLSLPSEFKPVTNEELSVIVQNNDFRSFIDQSSKVVERALDQDFNILIDYSHDANFNPSSVSDDDDDDGDDQDPANHIGLSSHRKRRRMKPLAHFFTDSHYQKRSITDVNFSSKFPELLLASYSKSLVSSSDPQGLLHVWNLHMHDRPEYTFHASSDILTAKFSPFHPNLIVAGSYSGQIMLWDTRSHQISPVQKTSLTGPRHTHPVYSLEIVGSQNANNIITASTDGVVCAWSHDMFTQPQEYIELVKSFTHKPEELATTCLAFSSDPNYFLAGSEEGIIVPCHRYDRAGAKAGMFPPPYYTRHTAPVMSLNFHPSHGPLDLSDLLLSSSLDWSVCLWRIRPPATLSASSLSSSGSISQKSTPTSLHSLANVNSSAHSTTNSSITTSLPSSATSSTDPPLLEYSPVLEFPHDDLVYDAKWSPIRPAIFAMVDGAGNLEIWDIIESVELPSVKINVAQVHANARRLRAATTTTNSTGPPANSNIVASINIPMSNSSNPANLSTKSSNTSVPNIHPSMCSLNRVTWEPNQAARLATGGLDGILSVFEVCPELAAAESVPDEWACVKRIIARHEAERSL